MQNKLRCSSPFQCLLYSYILWTMASARDATLDIVILGGSFAGLSAAHHFLRDIIDRLRITRTAPNYRVVLVSPSTHIYWNIGAPRGIVSPTWLPQDKLFVPILPAFRHYPSNRFHFIQGSATSVDLTARQVTVALHTPEPKTRPGHARHLSGSGEKVSVEHSISFHALIIATGTHSIDPLFSLHGAHEETARALDRFHDSLPNAESIIIAGGGPTGVECAGQLATFFNRPSRKGPGIFTSCMAARPSFLKGRLSRQPRALRQPKTISLISGNNRLLPKLPLSVGEKAERKLEELGVHVVHNTRVVSALQTPGGKTRCILDSEITIVADVYVAATGVRPNTQYLPPELLDASGYVVTDPNYLRVLHGGERVYCVGDCASYSKNYILDVYEAIPVLMHNLRNDLVIHELRIHNPYGGKETEILVLASDDVKYVQNPKDTQLIPITRWGGVGLLFGMKLPSLMVWAMKGRDYRTGKAKLVAGQGHNPYAPETYVYK